MQHPPPPPPRTYPNAYASGQTQPIPMRPPSSPAPPQAAPQAGAFSHLAIPPEEQPLRDLVGRLSQDGSLLVKQEIALAKQELGEKARRLGTQATLLALGGVTLYTGVLAMVAGLILLVAEGVAAWVAALLVGTAIATTGAILLLRGKNNLGKLDLKPARTVESVRRDIDAVKEAAHGT
jgi:hypothetical protein